MAAGDGLVSMTPSSIAHSGTSASINADGGVDFTAVTSLSLNGVFTSEMDNYLMVIGPIDASGATDIYIRYRASGTDASGTDYVRQELNANNTSVTGLRYTSQTNHRLMKTDSVQRSGLQCHIYGPALAQPTANRSFSARDFSGAVIQDSAGTHSLSVSYDGITILSDGISSITSNVHGFGYAE